MSPIFKHLIVVAGPSGSGKSTFVAQLGAGKLAKEIRDKLPAGADGWLPMKTAGSEFWFPLIIAAGKRREIAGATIHYNTTREKLLGGQYCDDPALALLRMARRLTVVNLCLPSERVVSQLRYREIEEPNERNRRQAKSIGRFMHVVRSSIMAAARLLPPLVAQYGTLTALYRSWTALELRAKRPSARKRNLVLEKMQRYRQPGWLEAVYRRWQDYLAALTSEGVKIEQIFLVLESSTKLGEGHGWRIVPGPAYTEAETLPSSLGPPAAD